MTINLSEPETQTLLQLLDGAVKFYGLGAANAAAHFQSKIAAAKETPPSATVPLDRPSE